MSAPFKLDPSRVSVLALPSCVDLQAGRVAVEVEPGLTLAEIVARVMPDAPEAARRRLRVTINEGECAVLPGLWGSVRPKAGARVLVRAAVEGEDIRSALTVVVAVAAIAAGQYYAPTLLASLSGLGVTATAGTTALASAAISTTVLAAGLLLIDAIVPVRQDDKDKPVYNIQGLRNQATPDGVVPLVLGYVRFAPPYAALPYTTAINDQNYVTAAFLVGYGTVNYYDWRIGTTPIGRYKNVKFESRRGLASDARLKLYRQQVVQKSESAELLTDFAPTGGEVIRTTPADVTYCEVDTVYPSGVFATDSDGKFQNFTVDITTRYRPAGGNDSSWVTGPTISVTSKQRRTLMRTTRINFPTRGRYEVGLTRVTLDWDDIDQKKKELKRSGRSAWSATRGFRPEYIINFHKPLAVAACQIRATGQLQGTLDELNVEVRSVCADWNAATSTWVTRETNNPASLFRYVLTGPAITYPLTTAEIDALGDWHVYCASKGLTYNRVHDYAASVLDVLADIAAAGRASPHDSGTKWGVVIDRVQTIIAADLTNRNTREFQGTRPYANRPHAFVVSFRDETNNHQAAQRVVPFPDHVGDISITEKLEMPGVTNPDQVWREARRRQYELTRRVDRYVVVQDIENLLCGRGDWVRGNFEELDVEKVSARVLHASATSVVLDEEVEFKAGTSYACRFRLAGGGTLLRAVSGSGLTRVLAFADTGALPAPGDLAMFGKVAAETALYVVKGVEAMSDFNARITLADAAAEIEALVDSEVPPPWSGRAGADAEEVIGTPLAPTVTDVMSGREASGAATTANPYPIVVTVAQDPADTIPIAQYRVRHRKTGTSTWGYSAAPAEAGAVLLPGYAKGDSVQLQAACISDRGTEGDYTATVTTHVVGENDGPLPVAPTITNVTSPAAKNIRVNATASTSASNESTQLYISSGAASTFASATEVLDPIYSGPNVALPQQSITVATAGVYRIWAVAIDNRAPAGESTPSAPFNVTVA